jgi:23S rRNA pseudouridine2605 synthase
MRINKYIASCGEASRRTADELIQKGKVSVNGAVLTTPGYDVQEGDEVRLFGRVITPEVRKAYYLLNKPVGYVTTTMDKEGRPTVMDLVQAEGLRLFPVGRLDYNTSGLLILTNDGDLSNKLMHPSKEFPKKYRVRAAGTVTLRDIHRLETGIDIGGFITSPAEAKLIRHDKNSTVVEITIHEGKNRQVRRMFKALGYPVQELERIGLGNLVIGRLARGSYRKLSKEEIEYLKTR